MTKVDLERPGQKERDKILAIWKPASDVTTDDKKILAISEKHLISVQIPQGKILTKLSHQSNFKVRFQEFLFVNLHSLDSWSLS